MTLENGAVIPWRRQNDDDGDGYYRQVLRAVCKQYSIPFARPVKELSLKQRDMHLWGTPKQGREGAHRLHQQRGAGTLLRNDV
jgi:excinuclease UvrABC ATPase subunit